MSVIKKTLELMTAAFAFVAALAWNDAVQTLFQKIFGPAQGIIAKFLYAGLITAIVVWVGIRLSAVNNILEKDKR
ncbi:hypothetical protein KKF59_02560 [Patescibacteria group bacterium]|nr:hypothetical protein [Patescibacteria group bacterium]MBU1034562.1 hypothetical protein [Patescibacteria group bacterium]MBU1907992.1 hypothetical protein [Patescibacteria group bacterium]